MSFTRPAPSSKLHRRRGHRQRLRRWALRRLSVEWLEDRTLLSAGTLATAIPLTFNTLDTAEASGFLADPRGVDLYRLHLGAGDRISAAVSAQAAAVSRVSCVRCYQLAYPGESARLLGEIALALDTLIDPAKWQAYDGLLEVASATCSGEMCPRAANAAPAPAGTPSTPTWTFPDRPTLRKRERARTMRHRRAPRWDLVAAVRPLPLTGPVGCEVVLRVRRS
jgi:hypothetical protein